MLLGIVLSILTCFCWGSTSICLRGVSRLDSIEMSLLRAAGGFAAAVAISLILHNAAGLLSLSLKEIAVFIVLVLCNNLIGDVFLFLALHKVGVARGSSIASSYPVLVAIFSALWFGEKLTFFVITGTLSVVAGVVCLCQKNEKQGQMTKSGLAYAVLASVFWALGLICNKYLVANHITPAVIVAGRGVTFMTISTAIWAARGLLRGGRSYWRRILVKDAWLALLAGILSLGCGAFLYSMALEYVPATVATPIGASNPLLAAIFALIIFKEKLRPIQWLGIVLAIAGSVMVTF